MALNAAIVWEMRQAGSASNGGGFRNNTFQSPPSAPAVAGASSGGTVAANTYYVAITYTSDAIETPISGETAVTTTGTTSKITVTHPTDTGIGATWSCYVATTSGGPYFPQGTGLPIGSDRVITTTPPTSGTQPAGTDRTLSTTPFVAVNNSTITATTAGANSNVLTFTGGYTPTGADVGNVFKAVSGTNINAGWYEITAITSTTWTVTGAQNLTTAGGAGASIVGNMGGAVDHPATINAILTITGQIVFVNYSATPYTFTTSLTNNNANIWWVGYDVTRTLNNTDANRPIWRAGANSVAFYTSSQHHQLTNLVFDNPSATFTGVGGPWTGGTVARCQFSDLAGAAALLMNGTGAQAEDCEFIRCSGTASLYMNAPSSALRCLFRACTTGVRVQGDGCTLVDCVATGTAGVTAFNVNGGSGALFVRCVAHGTTGGGGTGFAGASNSFSTFDHCVAYGNGAYGWDCPLNHGARLINCRGGNNTSGDYNPNTFSSGMVTGFVHLTGDPFTNAASFDFSTNATAGAGAACRGIAAAFPGGVFTSYPDAGAYQHPDPVPTTPVGRVLAVQNIGTY